MASQPPSLFYLPFRPALDANGIVAPGARLFFYLTQTSIPQKIYADAALTIELENPVGANAAGIWPSIYMDPSLIYRVILRDLNGVTLNEVDPYRPGIVGEGDPGPTGPANSTYTTLAALKAAAVSNASYIFAPPSGNDGGAAAGTFLYQTAGAPYTADGVNIIKLDAVPLTTGALVRQSATGIALTLGSGAPTRDVQAAISARAINMRDEGAALDGVTDNSAAFVRALGRGREVVIPGRMYINTTITLPQNLTLTGFNPQSSAIALGPNGKLLLSGPGFADPNNTNSLVDFGRCCFRNLTFAAADNVTDVTTPNMVLEKVRDLEFTNCVFYHIGLRLDNHRYLSFRKCRFYGAIPGAKVMSVCDVQPSAGQWINENLTFEDNFFSSTPVELVDTVEPMFIGNRHFGGSFGVKSYRNHAVGTTANPFFMGPILIANTYDSIDGLGIDIDGGGTNTRLLGNFVSAGRVFNQPGIYLSNCSGVEIVGNKLEWCGNHGFHVVNGQFMAFTGNTIANLAGGSGYYLNNVDRSSILGGAVYNRPLWGGSGNGNTKFAIETPLDNLANTLIEGINVQGMTDSRQAYITGTNITLRSCPGINFEYPLKAGSTGQRPIMPPDGYFYNDRTLAKFISFNRADNSWRDQDGSIV